MKTFRIWHTTEFGVGFEDRKAISRERLNLPKRLSTRVTEIEELDTLSQ